MTLTGALFVGGQSTRMGHDKALLEVGGEPLWSRQLQLLRSVNPDQLMVSCREHPSWCPAGVESIPDEVSAMGPLGGLLSTLARVNTSHLLALAIDLPKMNPRVLRELSSLSGPSNGVVPVVNGGFEPLCAIYPREALMLAREALDARELSLQRLVRDLIAGNLVVAWTVPSEFLSAFHNANSPSDLAQL